MRIAKYKAIRMFVYKARSLYPIGSRNVKEDTRMTKDEKSKAVPIWAKTNLTLAEAAAYTGIGINRLREMSDQRGCDYVLWVGNRRMFKRKKLEEYLEKEHSI